MVIDGVDVPGDGTTRIDRVGVLLERISHGDQSAFGRLYDLMSPRVFGLVSHLVSDRSSSEELLQEVFLEVWRSAARFDADSEQGRTWVLSIARRRAAERLSVLDPACGKQLQQDAASGGVSSGDVRDALPPLTLRSSLQSRIATMPQLPDLDPAVAAAAEPGEGWTRARGEAPPAQAIASAPEASDGMTVAATALPSAAGAPRAASAPEGRATFVEPAPTTTMIQAVQRRNWTRGLLLMAASLVVLVGLGFGAATVNEFVNRPPELIAVQQIEGAPDALSATAELRDGGSATVMWSDSVGKAVLISNGLPPIDAEEVFEVWFVRDEEQVSAGTFGPNENGGATVLLDGTVESGDVIEVTVEEADGSPRGEQTSDPIVSIPAS